jgi:hypothetical protein
MQINLAARRIALLPQAPNLEKEEFERGSTRMKSNRRG